MKPQFTPKQVGSLYTDPKTKKTWEFTKSGWIEKADSIQKDVENKGTFDVKLEENNIINLLKKGGSSETQIQEGLSQRRRIISNLRLNDDGTPIDQIENEEKPPIDVKNPFEGLSKNDVLRDAFSKGVTNKEQLTKLGDVYDMLATPDDEISLSGSSLEDQEVIKKSIEAQAVLKMQELPDAVSRDSALSALSTFRAGKDIISALDEGKVKTGLAEGKIRQGIFGIGTRALGKTTKEEDSFASLTEIFAANFRKALSGTAVAEGEMKRLDRFLPSETKTKQQNIEGIKALSKYLSDKTSLQLGYDVSPLIPKENEVNEDPMNLFKITNSKENPMGI